MRSHSINRIVVTIGITAGLLAVTAGPASAELVLDGDSVVRPSPVDDIRCPTLLMTTSTARAPSALPSCSRLLLRP